MLRRFLLSARSPGCKKTTDDQKQKTEYNLPYPTFPLGGKGKGGGKSPGYIFVKPGMSSKEMVQAVRSLKGVCFTSVGMRDAGQSDYKNRHRIYDLATLAPFYNRMGLFSSECHGGARWHVGS